MRVLLNAVSIKEGGPLVVLQNLAHSMAQQRPHLKWLIAAHPSVHLNIGSSIRVGDIDSTAGVLLWYECGLLRAAKHYRVDVIFSVTNYLPFSPTPFPTVLLEQHAGHFSEVFDQLQMANTGFLGRRAWRFKTWWVEQSVRKASVLTVQTSALADAIARRTARPRHTIRVVPHGPGIARLDRVRDSVLRSKSPRIGYVTKWGVQKNFGVLFRAAARLRATGSDFRLILTLDDRLPENRRTLEGAKALGLADIIENYGELGAERTAELYDTLDIFVYPSLVESFGFPIVEALARGLPLLIADTESNREVAGSGALTFVPDDDETLAGMLGRLIDKPALLAQAAAAAAARGANFNWETSASQTLALLDEALRLEKVI